ncbi:MAG TPA: PAS domain S-box protein [Candidatus Acidoferrales bacterium]|jgi:PAS domain S-box-containing protein|nr:PAS domain S-box protein [Candidatus Acidoferrales bacterium]
MFQLLFERSADAILLVDPQTGRFVDCNQATVELMRADSKERFLNMRPEDFSPPLQPDGTPSGQKTAEIIALVEKNGGHRFEWVGRRLDGTEFPMEVLVTSIRMDGRSLNVSVARDITDRKRTEAALRESEEKFRELFDASADAILILDPQTQKYVACNDAAVKMVGGPDKAWLLAQTPETLAPEQQPDGRSSREAAGAWIERALAHGTQRFEWLGRRANGEDIPMDLLLSPVRHGGNLRLMIVARDDSERKKTEQELLELNQSLERRVTERTVALTASEAQFRALVEHAPEAIVVFDGVTGRFHFGNEHASALYGVPLEKLAELTPADVSPEFQPGGRRSAELARELMDEALAGGTPVFEWIHQRPGGQLIPTEVRLLRLPAEGRNLIRASIIDNTERKRADQALRESEEKFRALFEGSSHGVILHDENQFLEVNPAAVRIMGRQSAQELLGKFPTDASPPFQPNGESSAVLTRKHIQECLTNGSARFEWVSCTPQGREIQLEVSLTRIQWSGRQVIQALLDDISERKQAEAELRASERRLRESEARFSAAFHASPIITAISRARDAKFVLANDSFLNWTGYSREEVLGRTANELGVWESPADRQRFWEAVRSADSIRGRECGFRNRHGKVSTMLASGVVIEFNGEEHLLAMLVDISHRKQAEAELQLTLAREKELSQLKSNFVSMVSHEFRTPLGIIQSSAELLRDFYQKMRPAEREEQLESITRNTRRMVGMMEEILVLSRLDAGKLDFQPAPLDLNVFCHRIVDEVRSATNHRCDIHVSLNSVPPESRADERLLGHIFINVLSNAVKYSESGQTVRFTVDRDGLEAVCVIRDEGIGISEEDRQHLFKAFHRGGNVGTRPGTGLGLLLVKRCAELHGGKVQLDSQIGRGTIVTVRLPIF